MGRLVDCKEKRAVPPVFASCWSKVCHKMAA